MSVSKAYYSLAHVPDLVCYGSKPSREIRANPALEQQLKNQLRSFSAATAYAPHQVYIGNITPAELSNLPKPGMTNSSRGLLAMGVSAISWIRIGSTASLRSRSIQSRYLEENWSHEHPANMPTVKPCA